MSLKVKFKTAIYNHLKEQNVRRELNSFLGLKSKSKKFIYSEISEGYDEREREREREREEWTPRLWPS